MALTEQRCNAFQDGCVLPDDWYLRITGKAAHFLRRNEMPSARLDDVLRP